MGGKLRELRFLWVVVAAACTKVSDRASDAGADAAGAFDAAACAGGRPGLSIQIIVACCEGSTPLSLGVSYPGGEVVRYDSSIAQDDVASGATITLAVPYPMGMPAGVASVAFSAGQWVDGAAQVDVDPAACDTVVVHAGPRADGGLVDGG